MMYGRAEILNIASVSEIEHVCAWYIFSAALCTLTILNLIFLCILVLYYNVNKRINKIYHHSSGGTLNTVYMLKD